MRVVTFAAQQPRRQWNISRADELLRIANVTAVAERCDKYEQSCVCVRRRYAGASPSLIVRKSKFIRLTCMYTITDGECSSIHLLPHKRRSRSGNAIVQEMRLRLLPSDIPAAARLGFFRAPTALSALATSVAAAKDGNRSSSWRCASGVEKEAPRTTTKTTT
uniref:Uncharacterized protein n=1 Tax=Trichogramma kaykai TaxID=54128 RepID=A0ABD2W4B6_9HYME